MPDSPEFDRILKYLTDEDVAKFITNDKIPEDERKFVLSSDDPMIRRRFLAGYYVRTNKRFREPKPSTAKKPRAKKVDTTTILGRREHTYTHGEVIRIDPKTGERIKV